MAAAPTSTVLSFRISTDLVEALDAYVQVAETTRSEFVVTALRAFLERRVEIHSAPLDLAEPTDGSKERPFNVSEFPNPMNPKE